MGPEAEGLEVIGELGWVKNTLFMILFSLLPKRVFHTFPLGFDIAGHVRFHCEDRGIRRQREEGSNWIHQEQE